MRLLENIKYLKAIIYGQVDRAVFMRSFEFLITLFLGFTKEVDTADYLKGAPILF